jgi:hypothetical protein
MLFSTEGGVREKTRNYIFGKYINKKPFSVKERVLKIL